MDLWGRHEENEDTLYVPPIPFHSLIQYIYLRALGYDYDDDLTDMK